MALENTKFREAIDKTFDRKMQIRGRICCTYFLFLIISLAKKKKQTNKQTHRKNVGRDTATAVANYSGRGY